MEDLEHLLRSANDSKNKSIVFPTDTIKRYGATLAKYGTVNDHTFTIGKDGVDYLLKGGYNGMERQLEFEKKLAELDSKLKQAQLYEIPSLKKRSNCNMWISIIAAVISLLALVFDAISTCTHP